MKHKFARIDTIYSSIRVIVLEIAVILIVRLFMFAFSP